MRSVACSKLQKEIACDKLSGGCVLLCGCEASEYSRRDNFHGPMWRFEINNKPQPTAEIPSENEML